MAILLQIVGCVVVVCLAIAFAAVACACASHNVERLYEKFKATHHLRVATELGREIVSTAYWFSEEPKAMLALRAVGERIRDTGGMHQASGAREIWYRLIAEKEAKERR